MIKVYGVLVALAASFVFAHAGNLYRGDTSAETETDSLTRGNFSTGLLPFIWDSDTAFDGKRSIRVDWDRKQRHIATTPTWYDKWLSIADSPDLEPGETYTFSFYAKSSVDGFPLDLHLLPAAAWDYYSPGGNYKKRLSLSRDWQRYSFSFIPRIKAGAPVNGYCAILDFSPSPAASVWYDAVQIEKGKTPTAYGNISPMNVGVRLNSGHWSNIYLAGEKIRATFHVFLPPQGKAVLESRIVDYRGQCVNSWERKINASGEFSVELDKLPLGWFKLTASLSHDGQVLSSHSVNFIRIMPPEPSFPGIPPFAGLIDNSGGGFDHFDIMRKLGVKRVETQCGWSGQWGVEPSPGKFDFSALEWQLRRGRESGMVNKVMICPFKSPDCFFSREELAEVKKISGKRFLLPPKDKLGQWRDFIGMVAGRYGDMIDEIELGSEDNGRLGANEYYKSKFPEYVKDGWMTGGPPFDMLCDMVRTGAAEIRKTRPNMKIGAIRPSRSGSNDKLVFTREMFKRIGKDFNILPVDFYLYPYTFGPDENRMRGKSDIFIDDYRKIRAVIDEYGNNQPVYMSEFGWFPDVRFPDDSIYRRQQAETMPKDYIVARVAGFFAFDWFLGFGGINSGKYSTRMQQHLKIQSIAAAYSAVARIVENVTGSKWFTPDEYTRIAVMRKHDGKGVAAAWTDDDAVMTLPTHDPMLSVTDLMGNPVTPQNRILKLDQAPLYFHHPDYNVLCTIMENSGIRMNAFCDIRFRMLAEHTGRILLNNRGGKYPVTLDLAAASGNNTVKEKVTITNKSGEARNISIGGDAVTVKVTGNNGGCVEKTFAIPKLTAIPFAGNADSVIAKAENRGDIHPVSDPWVSWAGPHDLSLTASAGWDANFLYLKIEVRDDLHFNRYPASLWNGDSLQIAIDPKNNGEFYTPRHGGSRLGPDHFEFTLALNSDSRKTLCKFSHGKNICAPGNVSISRNDTDGITSYSLKLPWTELGVKPFKNMVFGMSLCVFDDDTGGGQNYHAPVGGGIVGDKSPSGYRKFILR